MAFLTVLIVGLISYIDYGGSVVRFVHGDAEVNKEVPRPPYPGSPKPDEQLAMTSGNVPEELVFQEGQLHARSDDPARRYAGQEQEAGHDTDADGLSARQFKLPKLPIPTEILDIPKLIPTRIKDILSDLPAIPTIPTDPGDIVDLLPTDPGELISDLPIPSLPTIPAIPTLPIPVPIPTSLPDLPIPPGTDLPDLPLPTGLPPSKPNDPGDIYKLPDLTEIPKKVLGLLHHAISQLSTDPGTPKYLRDVLRLILRVLNRLGGGDPVPKPWPSSTLTLPVPTKTKLPLPTLTVPTLPLPTLPLPTRPLPSLTLPTTPSRPTLTLPNRSKLPGDNAGQFGRAARKVRNEEGAGGGKEPLSDERRKELRDSVADEVWAAADWSNPLEASITAAMAMVSFDAIYRVAEALGRTDDDAEKEKLYGLFVVVDDEEIEAAV